jgi:hypothetical protein
MIQDLTSCSEEASRDVFGDLRLNGTNLLGISTPPISPHDAPPHVNVGQIPGIIQVTTEKRDGKTWVLALVCDTALGQTRLEVVEAITTGKEWTVVHMAGKFVSWAAWRTQEKDGRLVLRYLEGDALNAQWGLRRDGNRWTVTYSRMCHLSAHLGLGPVGKRN